MEDIVPTNPNIILSKLAASTDRKYELSPTRNIDPKLWYYGDLAHAKQNILKSHNKKVTESEIGADSLDRLFAFSDKLPDRKR